MSCQLKGLLQQLSLMQVDLLQQVGLFELQQVLVGFDCCSRWFDSCSRWFVAVAGGLIAAPGCLPVAALVAAAVEVVMRASF